MAILSPNGLPMPAGDSIPYRLTISLKSAGDFVNAKAPSVGGKYFLNFRWGEDHVGAAKYANPVNHVFALRNPFEVCGTVVVPYAVDVVNEVLPLDAWQKSKRHQSMRRNGMANAIQSDARGNITGFTRACLEKPPKPAQAAVSACAVTGKARDISPMLFHKTTPKGFQPAGMRDTNGYR